MLTLLPVTLTAAAAAAILNVWLMIRIGAIRRAENISVGDEDNENLIRRMRAQANFVESTPFVLILIAAIEISGRGEPWLAWVAGIYMLGRVAHAFGMDGGSLQMGRMIGTLTTMLALLGLAIVAVLISVGVM
ncbi:MAPEG family protein [Altererythrobacter lutimaris]|uniref:MAPEG family protein n=1 Tax=Altererythrobacter lutimaris TaxID=2743979 RepID=A0A850HCB0_9SPHN|nr:MAPEG family protein [Altererythrobacter lutimaris]NVE94258.1 MAPEG family protein [Altererythrobacter lutimaris]